MLRNLFTGFGFLLLSTPAGATWLRAESAHFIVYSEGDEASVRSAATRLEKLDALQRTVAGAPKGAGARVRSPLKVRVYLLPTSADVQKTAGNGNVAGYYSATVRGPFAVMTRENNVADGFSAQLVLFHELTHHFMFQYFPATYPTWYQEGFADFIGSSTIDASDVVKFGRPVLNRYFSLRGRRADDWISLKQLLTAKRYADLPGRVDLLYAEGWLLTHYLTFEKKREGQLARYLAGINAGKPYDVAARDAFGDLDQLNKELRAYAYASRLPAGVLTLQAGDMGPVTVTPASPAQSALMMTDIRIGTGVLATEAAHFARETSRIAARYPDDPFALRLRGEVDRLAGDQADEAATVAHWASIAPTDPLMMLHRGQLAIDALVSAKSHDADAWRRAHELVLDAHRAAPQNAEILKAYYDGFVTEGVLPPVGAHNALMVALELVPQDDEVRYQLASDFEKRGMIADAIATIRPSAFGLNDDSDKSPRQKAREKRRQAKYRNAGEVDHESAREMLVRLETSTQSAPAAPPAAPS